MTQPSPPPPAGWENILNRDEVILWQGRPDTALALTLPKLGSALFGIAFAGFALFWMVMAARSGGFFWAFGLIHFCAGLGIVFTTVLGGPLRRRNSWYTLSNQRAFIATDMPLRGKRLRSFPITADTRLSLTDTTPGTVWFATQPRRGNRGNTGNSRIGFHRIPDAPEVYRLMRDIQRTERQADRQKDTA
ncbi:hypothetical protein [Thalassovita taeanensis]|uniref:Aspartate carbamoyltransferase catalytic subunit n=1 Tax=Thalassovita taeanensis TaxID=657014 RepID=A0A1H9AT60_9RHOB|nr:hypothetical protein [Thalassovita taeanensis]SEP80012.1 hypothetical protein SAMN04488092_102258 [Thalassovita taeanensis]